MANANILAVVGDLFFVAKINETAKQLGVTLKNVTNEAVLMERAKDKPALIIFDLNYSAMRPVELISKLKADAALKDVRLLGFLSHVQTDLKTAAEAAGCDEVMPRSAFSANLPEILAAIGKPN
jgi:CheY-like chemotaxis protein